MPKIEENLRNSINRYYSRRESRWGYKYLLKGVKHYGYYPNGRRGGLTMAEAQSLMEEHLARSLDLPGSVVVLDAGCGEGHVALHLAKKYKRVYGIDILDWSIRKAKLNKKKSSSDNVEFKTMDYSATDFPDNFFDGIYTMETLVHSPDYKKTLKELRRILKPDGVIVHHEYVLDDNLPPDDEDDWRTMYSECPMMSAFDGFRQTDIARIWEQCGFERIQVEDITKEMTPFMKRLYQIAFVPYYLLKLFGKHRNHVNTFAGVRSYQLRHEFHYTVVKAVKPKS